MTEDVVHDEEPEPVRRCAHEGAEEIDPYRDGQSERSEEHRPGACEDDEERIPGLMGNPHDVRRRDVL